MTQDEINAVKKAAEKMRKQESAQDEIIEMAREAGLYQDINVSFHQALRNFYGLAAAKEQKKWQDQTAVEIHEAMLEEREACAKVCDELVNKENSSDYQNAANWCSVRIRARGEKA